MVNLRFCRHPKCQFSLWQWKSDVTFSPRAVARPFLAPHRRLGCAAESHRSLWVPGSVGTGAWATRSVPVSVPVVKVVGVIHPWGCKLNRKRTVLCYGVSWAIWDFGTPCFVDNIGQNCANITRIRRENGTLEGTILGLGLA